MYAVTTYARPTPPTTFGSEPAPPPTLSSVAIRPSPTGLLVEPRVRAASWLIEAVVWLAAACVAVGLILFSTEDWVRAIAALVLVPLGIRALCRTIRFVASKSLRRLTIAWRTYTPHVAGPFVQLPVAGIAGFNVERSGSDHYFCAIDGRGRLTHLVTLEASDAPDYEALATWLVTQGFVANARR